MTNAKNLLRAIHWNLFSVARTHILRSLQFSQDEAAVTVTQEQILETVTSPLHIRESICRVKRGTQSFRA